MMSTNRYYSPDHTDQPAAADEHTIDAPQGTAAMSDDDNQTAAENAMSAADDETRLSDSDSTIMGAGGLAGGLSGDGERTDEYDAAIMGLDD